MRRPVLRSMALAVVLAAAAAMPAAQAAPVVSVVVVSTEGAATSFATVPGEPYLITVTGAFDSYEDDFVPLHRIGDCAWWFHVAMAPSDAVTVDGSPAGCQGLPYSQTHTYQWAQTGTGAPFWFAIAPIVAAGALTFTVTGARAQVTHGVTASCALHPAATSTLDYVPVVVDAAATASQPESAASTYVACDVTTSRNESVHVRLGLPGPAVRAAERVVAPHGDMLTVCSYGGGSWTDGVEVTTEPACYQTTLP